MEGVNIPKALTIAGSDSGGGAGIQADLKTFAALGVHGMSAVTAITAQNTVEVTAVHDVPPELVEAQIKAVKEDIGIDAAKTGMLNSIEIIDVLAKELKGTIFPIVVDPVMIAKSGARLIKPEAVGALIEKILPLATVLTPNVHEAEVLSSLEISDVEKAKEAAVKIAELGPKAVIVKGGHLRSKENVIDVLYLNGEFEMFGGKLINRKTTHGTGCSFASAITAGLAKGESVSAAVRTAKDFIEKAIRYGLNIGKGYGPVNPVAWLSNEAERYETWKNVVEAIRMLESDENAVNLVPEVQMNLVMATPCAASLSDVVGIPGRIVQLRDHVKASSCPEFGASRHVASMILTAMTKNPAVRSGMNIRYSTEIIDSCRKLGFSTASYDRRKEPEHLREVEGATIPWGAKSAIESTGLVPDVIYHLGDWGKEPMATVLGSSGTDVVEKALKIASNLKKTASS